jgi:hypothetical protein
MIYAISGWIIMRYIKLPIIVRYRVRSDKCKLLEEKYLGLTLVRVSTVLLSVTLACSKISATYFDWKKGNLWMSKLS